MCKTRFLLSFLCIAVSFSCAGNETSPTNSSAVIDTQTYTSVGVIRGVDPDGGRVTVDHEDIPGYMPAMEMTEPVADKALLDGLKPGDKVEFELLREGSKLTFTKFVKVGVVALIDSRDIYKISCAECHGPTGEGAEKGIPLTSGHALDHSEADFIETVTNGKSLGKKKEMPAFREKLTPEQIKEIVRFVREEIQKGLKRNEGHKH